MREVCKNPQLCAKVRRAYLPWYKRICHYIGVTVTLWWEQQPGVILHRITKQQKRDRQRRLNDSLGLEGRIIAKLGSRKRNSDLED